MMKSGSENRKPLRDGYTRENEIVEQVSTGKSINNRNRIVKPVVGERRVISQIKLRSAHLKKLYVKEVKSMLKEKDFFDSRWNNSAPGFLGSRILPVDVQILIASFLN